MCFITRKYSIVNLKKHNAKYFVKVLVNECVSPCLCYRGILGS